MGVLAGMLTRPQERNVSLTDTDAFRELGWLGTGASGVSVTPDNALKYSAVWACVKIIAETVASLPLITYQRLTRGKARATNFYLYRLLHTQPNPLMTSFQWRETILAHTLTWGNGYNWLEIDGAGRLAEIWPLLPNKMHEIRREGSELWYRYELPNGRMEWYPGWRIWQIPGLGFDGITGYSPIGMARQAIGLGLAAEEFGARFFGNDARPGGVLEHPGKLSDPAHKRLMDSWESRHQGLSKSHKTAILEEGMKYTQIGIPPEDAQFLETRVHQRREIYSIYRVPPHKAGDLEKSAFSNIEHQGIEFVTDTIRPWLVRIEQSIDVNLLTEQERLNYFVEFLVDGLLRGDVKARYEAYSIGRNNGWLSADDIRELENMNPLPGGQGQVYLVPLNMIPADQVGMGERGAAGGWRLAVGEERGRGEGGNIAENAEGVAEGGEGRGSGWMEKRGVAERRRAMVAYRRVIGEAVGRVLRREANDVGNRVKKELGAGARGRVIAENAEGVAEGGEGRGSGWMEKRGMESLGEWLDGFYKEHEDFVFRQVLPVMLSYGEQVAAAAGDEAGDVGPGPEAIERFTRSYVSAYASRHVIRSRDELETALGADEPLGAVDVVMERWRNERPESVGHKESGRMNGAMARMVFAAAGILSLVWMNFGESCPYCESLNGKRVGIAEAFLGMGSVFQPAGAERPLVPNHEVHHPPVHDGCDCMVGVG